jgi:hypothetical protein
MANETDKIELVRYEAKVSWVSTALNLSLSTSLQ